MHFYLGNKRKFYLKRTFKYAILYKIINKVKKHLKGFTAKNKVSYFFTCVNFSLYTLYRLFIVPYIANSLYI